MNFVSTVKKSDTLVAAEAPVIQKFVDNSVVFEHHVVNMAVSLPVQCNCRRLTFGADPLGPRRMTLTAGHDLAVNVLEGEKLTAVDTRSLLTKMRVEREMLNLLLLEIVIVVRLKRRTVKASAVVWMKAQLVFLSFDSSI